MIVIKKGVYEKYIKRFMDIVVSLVIIVLFSGLFIVIAFMVRKKMGSPVIFKQPRPGLMDINGNEQIFNMYKFRTMANTRDECGNLLPDSERLPKFGKTLRATSLDELPELFNILFGQMSLIGPRPQLVKDMVFMTDEQRKRHTVRPGLSGLAQVMGRNAISWEDKFKFDLIYIEKVTFKNDLKIFILTIKKVFGRKENAEEIDITDDYGDWLLKNEMIGQEQYNTLQKKAAIILLKYSKDEK